MSNEIITEYNLLENVRLVALEVMNYNPDATDIGELAAATSEQAEGLVNVYYYGCVQEWVAVGMPNVEDYGSDAPIHDEDDITTGRIYREASAAMYWWYEEKITDVLIQLLEQRNAEKDEND